MKILIYVNTKQNFHNTNNLGGIEILNFDLYNYLKKHYKTLLTNSLTTKIKKTKWDIVISSNDSIVFDLVDDYSLLKKHYNTRQQIYKKHGGTIKDYDLSLI